MQVEETIEAILRGYCGSQEKAISNDRDIMKDLGLDSMEWMSFLMDMEAEFEVEIPDKYFFGQPDEAWEYHFSGERPFPDCTAKTYGTRCVCQQGSD